MSEALLPTQMFSTVTLIANLFLFGFLYHILPSTNRTGQLRYLIRFAVIWAIGDMGHRWAFIDDNDVLRPIMELVLLIGMASMSVSWVHLSWVVRSDIEGKASKKRMDVVLSALYIVAVAFIILGFVTYDGDRALPVPYIYVFQGWFLACLIWSIGNFMGGGWKEAPRMERRARTLMTAGAGIMFFFVMNDLALGLLLGTRFDIAVIPMTLSMALVAVAFIQKRTFIVEPVHEKVKAGRKMKRRAKAGGPLGYRLGPGRIYHDLNGSRKVGPEVLKAMLAKDRVALVITDRDPERFRKAAGIKKVPIVTFSTGADGGHGGIDTGSKEQVEMVLQMVREFEDEATDVKGGEGSVVIFEGVHRFIRNADRKVVRDLFKGLRTLVKASETLRLVLVGSQKGMGKMARFIERSGRPLIKD